MSGPKCIVCGKPIAKKTESLYFRETRPYRPATPRSWGGEYPEEPAITDGTRDRGTLYLDQLPRNRAEAQRHVNGEIISASRSGDVLSSVNYWDDESYVDEFFHAQSCAVKQGYAAARDGHRWTWRN